MPGDVLLDTNIVIALFAGERKVLRKLKRATVFLPAIVVGELFYGALKSARGRENVTRIEEFMLANVVLPCDIDTARHYGQIKQQLRRGGRPLPENDIWIAALARQHDLTLISRDSHFQEVDDLKLEVW
jgi:tRNA(fMet)-specific endonuclease VapC